MSKSLNLCMPKLRNMTKIMASQQLSSKDAKHFCVDGKSPLTKLNLSKHMFPCKMRQVPKKIPIKLEKRRRRFSTVFLNDEIESSQPYIFIKCELVNYMDYFVVSMPRRKAQDKQKNNNRSKSEKLCGL